MIDKEFLTRLPSREALFLVAGRRAAAALSFSMVSRQNDGQMKLIHEGPNFVVVEKASGFLSVPGRGPGKRDCVAARIKEVFPGCLPQPAVHRLDMDTSGLMVLALTAAAHKNLSRQFENREVKKEYIALLEGELAEESGVIELPFRLDVNNRPHQILDEKYGKMGVTHWEKLFIEEPGLTRVKFMPLTGRTHQLRVHAAHERGLGIPIAGDPLYGNGDVPGQMKLHASALSFLHPENVERIEFRSDPPW